MEKTKLKTESPPVFVINALNSAGVCMKKIIKDGKKLTFEINRKEKPAAIQTMGKRNISYSILSERGIKTDARRLLMRVGMWAGIIIGLALIFLYSASLLRIRVIGNNRVDEAKILEAAGVNPPILFASPDLDKIEKRLVALEGVSGASVVRKGTTLEITVLEELPDTEIIDTKTPAPLVAAEDCVITRIVATQGTAVVKAGDTVKKGDILIAAYITDSEGNQVPVRAMGEADGMVYYQRHAFYSHRMIAKVRTGAKEEKTVMEIPGLSYQKPSSFVSYDTETKVILCSNILPFKLIKTTYYETREQETDFNYEALRLRLIEENLEMLKASVPKGGRFVNWWYLEKRLDKNTILSIYYQMERAVAVRP